MINIADHLLTTIWSSLNQISDNQISELRYSILKCIVISRGKSLTFYGCWFSHDHEIKSDIFSKEFNICTFLVQLRETHQNVNHGKVYTQK